MNTIPTIISEYPKYGSYSWGTVVSKRNKLIGKNKTIPNMVKIKLIIDKPMYFQFLTVLIILMDSTLFSLRFIKNNAEIRIIANITVPSII